MVHIPEANLWKVINTEIAGEGSKLVYGLTSEKASLGNPFTIIGL
jgi:hypothetical protein